MDQTPPIMPRAGPGQARSTNMSAMKTTQVTVESPRKGEKTLTSHLGLTVPMTSLSTSRPMKQRTQQFDPEKTFIYDSDEDTNQERSFKRKPENKPEGVNKGALVYRKLCKKYGKVAVNTVVRQFGRSIISLDSFNLSRKELKAFFIACVETYINKDDDEDRDLQQLNMGGNTLGTREVDYLIDFITVHVPLITVSLSGCKLCSNGLRNLTAFVKINKSIQNLDLSDNNIRDCDGALISDIIEHGESLRELNLSHNELCDSGTEIGTALGKTYCLKKLDLSWNHIRGKGAIGLCKGLAVNSSLESLLLSWNGFGYEGSAAMGYALKENTTLLYLDLANNRIHPPALFELMKGLEKNKSLSSLGLGQNPITSNMTSVLLTAIHKSKESNLKELDLQGIVVDKEFETLLKEIQETKIFIVRYDTSLPLNKGPITQIDPKNIFNIDPIRILYIMKEHLRTIDLFLKVDTNGDQTLSREEMKYAFEMEGFAISDTALSQVMDYLDTNKDGGVDLLLLKTKLDLEICMITECIELDDQQIREFINGERRLKRKLLKEEEEKLLSEREENQKFSQAFTSSKQEPPPRKLPPLNKPRMSKGN